MNKNILLIVLLLFAGVIPSMSQSFNDRFQARFSGSLYSGIQRTPAKVVELVDHNGNSFKKLFYYDLRTLVGVGFDPKLNLVEISDNLALSLNVGVDLSVAFGEDQDDNNADLAIRVPATLRVDLGAGSTLNTLVDNGGYGGIGMMFTAGPLIRSSLPEGVSFSNTFFTPVAVVGYNWYTGDRFMGMVIHGWPGKVVNYSDPLGNPQSVRAGYYIQLSYNYYVGYY